MEVKELHCVDKSQWARGPWDNEPDLVLFEDEETKLPCLICRNSRFGCLNGYVGVRKGHPAFKVDHDEISFEQPIVFSGFREEDLEMLGEAAKAKKMWWFGFDTAYGGDFLPSWSMAGR